jgi:hypothetical protein
MSVDAEPILKANGLNSLSVLTGYPGYSLINVEAGHARAKALAVVPKPLRNNPAHTEVIGKKTQAIANYLMSSATWVHLEPKVT